MNILKCFKSLKHLMRKNNQHILPLKDCNSIGWPNSLCVNSQENMQHVCPSRWIRGLYGFPYVPRWRQWTRPSGLWHDLL